MDSDQKNIQRQTSSSGEALPVRKNLLRRKWFLCLLILCTLIVIPGIAGSFLLLGEAQDYPRPVIGIHHFRVMNDLRKKYRKERRRHRKLPVANRPEYITLRFNNPQLNALLDIGRAYAKPIEDFTWNARIREDGAVLINFSRRLIWKIGLNGEVHLIPAFREGRFHFQALYFRLGRLVLAPEHLQKRLDRTSAEIGRKKMYRQILKNVHSASFHSGNLVLTLKGDFLKGIPLMGF